MSIKKLKPFITAVGVMLLLAAVTMGYFSAQRLSSIIPASGYEDKGVFPSYLSGCFLFKWKIPAQPEEPAA